MGAVTSVLVVVPVALGICLGLIAIPKKTLYLMPLFLAFEYRVRVGSLSVDLCELCAAVALFLWLIGPRESEPTGNGSNMKENGWLIALIALTALPGVFVERDLHHAVSVYRDLMLPLVFLLAFLQLKLDRAKVVTLINLMCLLAVANASLGIVQYFTGDFLGNVGPNELAWQEYKTGLVRMTPVGQFLGIGHSLAAGLYNETNNFATFLSVPLCLVSTLAFCSQLTRRQRLLSGLAGAAMLVAIVFSLFRSGLLVYAISMLLVFLFRKKAASLWRVLAVLDLVAGLALVFLTPGYADFDEFGSFQGRIYMFSEAANLIATHPLVLLTGGFTDFYFGHYPEIQAIHNMFLYSTVQFGLPATILFVAIFARFLWRAARVISQSPLGLDRDLLLAITVSLAGNVFLYGQTTMLIDSVQTSIWLFFWMACAMHLSEDLQSYPARAVSLGAIAGAASA